MKIHLSSMRSCVLRRYQKLRPSDRLNILISYANLGGDTFDLLKMRKNNEISSIFLDSGTYSTLRGDIEIRLKSYIEYLRLFDNDYDMYFSFDEDYSGIGFSEVNLENLNQMRKVGLNPVPVVHDIDSSETDYFIKEGFPTIALGSSETSSISGLNRFFDKICNHKIKVHLLGVTEYEKLVKYPIYSCDSSTWNKALIPGYLYWWNPTSSFPDKTERVYLGRYGKRASESIPHYPTYESLDKLKSYLRTNLDMSMIDLLGNHANQNLQLANMFYFVQLEEMITNEHMKQGYYQT